MYLFLLLDKLQWILETKSQLNILLYCIIGFWPKQCKKDNAKPIYKMDGADSEKTFNNNITLPTLCQHKSSENTFPVESYNESIIFSSIYFFCHSHFIHNSTDKIQILFQQDFYESV